MVKLTSKKIRWSVNDVVVKRVHIGSHDFFVGKVVSRLANPEFLGEDGKVDYDKLKPIVYLSLYYTTHGEVPGIHGFTRR